MRIARQLEVDPKASLPESFRNPSQLEGTYRFFGNERIDLGIVVTGLTVINN